MTEKKKQLTAEDMLKLFDKLYKITVNGVEPIDLKDFKIPLDLAARPANEIAADYLNAHDTVDEAAKSFIKNQIKKCTATSVLTSLGGALSLPIAIPANIGGVMLFQMQMVTVLAYMGGHDLKSDQVKTVILMYTAGLSIEQSLKKNGAQLSAKYLSRAPGEALKLINRHISSKTLLKFTEKTVATSTKAVPIVGGVLSGGLDYLETKQLAKLAYTQFIAKEETSTENDTIFNENDFNNSEYIEVEV